VSQSSSSPANSLTEDRITEGHLNYGNARHLSSGRTSTPHGNLVRSKSSRGAVLPCSRAYPLRKCRRNMLSEKDLSPTIHFTSKNQLKRSQLSKNHLTPSHFISLHLARCTGAVHPQNAHPPKNALLSTHPYSFSLLSGCNRRMGWSCSACSRCRLPLLRVR
jgi:hypothetical protein